MEKEFVPYELALKMKALGFDEPCLASWSYTYELQQHIEFKLGYIIDGPKNYTNAPTFSQAFRRFRDNNGMYHNILTEESTTDGSVYFRPFVNGFELPDTGTYEEAELACLEKLIEIVESKSE